MVYIAFPSRQEKWIMAKASPEATLQLRVYFGAWGVLGPGKIGLLEMVDRHASISAAGRSMKMSYRRAWLLIHGLNAMFKQPVVLTRHGGTGGGQASLTPFGRKVVHAYRATERSTARSAERYVRMLKKALAKTAPAAKARPS